MGSSLSQFSPKGLLMRRNRKAFFQTALSAALLFTLSVKQLMADEWSTIVSELIIQNDAVAHEYNASQEALSRMLTGSLSPFNAATVNQPCVDQSNVCILFVNRSDIENIKIRGRPKRILERLPGNLLAVKPNLILVDSVLADQLIFATDLIGFSYAEYKSRLEEADAQAAIDQNNRISSIRAAELRRSADTLGIYAQSAVLTYLEMVRNHRVTVVNDNGAERLSAAAEDNPDLEELWSSLLWPVAHELGHLKQFSRAEVEVDDLGLFGWFKNSQVRKLEDEADLFAEGVVKKYLNSFPKIGIIDWKVYLPVELSAIGITASATVWKWSGSRFVLFSRTARPFGSRLFSHQLEPCKSYIDWKEGNGLLMPPVPNQAVLSTYEDRVRNSKDDGLLLYTRSEWGEIASNISNAVDDKNTHGFEYNRGKSVQGIIRAVELPKFFHAALQVDERLDELIESIGAIDNLVGEEVPKGRTVTLDYPFDHETEAAGVCAAGLSCFVSMITNNGESFGREESSFDLESGSFYKSDLLVWLINFVFEPPSDSNEFSMSPTGALITEWLSRVSPNNGDLISGDILVAAFESFAEGMMCGYGSRVIDLPNSKELNLTFDARCGCLYMNLR